jgi:palmitoyltransferase
MRFVYRYLQLISMLTLTLQVKYLLDKHNDNGAAIAVLVVYFVLFLFMAASYFRLTHLTFFHPPFVPLGSAAIRAREARRQARNERNTEDVIGGSQYNDSDDGQNDPNSPGLELFYSKDVFVCDQNGKPRWCYHCKNVRSRSAKLHIFCSIQRRHACGY